MVLVSSPQKTTAAAAAAPPKPRPSEPARTSRYSIMTWTTVPALALVAAINVQWLLNPKTVAVSAQDVPAQAQVINQASWNGMSLRTSALPSRQTNC